MSARRGRAICIIAFTCEPDRGSEYEVGWRWARAAARCAEHVVVLTRRASLERIPGKRTRYAGWAAKQDENLVFVGIDWPLIWRALPGRRLMRMHYAAWQLLVLVHLLRRKRDYDLVHHVAFVAVWMPSVGGLAGHPFVWGPLGTNRPVPQWMPGSRIKGLLRNIVTRWSVRVNPLLRLSQRVAKRLIAINEDVAGLLAPNLRSRTIIHRAIGLDASQITASRAPRARRQRMILHAGRYAESKLSGLVAAAGVRILQQDPSARVLLVGEGLKERFSAMTIPGRFEIFSEIPQADLWRLMEEAEVFLFPSVEGSGFVVLEAMAKGTPVVCLERTGPADFVGREGGILCRDGPDFEAVASTLSSAAVRLLNDAELWEEKSIGAWKRAATDAWDKLPAFLETLYRETLIETS